MGIFTQVSLLESGQAACGLWPTVTNVTAEDSICLTACSVNTVACKSPKIAQPELATFQKRSILAPGVGAVLLRGGTLPGFTPPWRLGGRRVGWGCTYFPEEMALLPCYTLRLEVSSIKLCPGVRGSDRAFSKSLCTRDLALWKPKALAVGRSISQTTPIKVQQCEALTARTTKIYGFLKMKIMTSLGPHSYAHSHFFCPGGSSSRCLVLHMAAGSLVFGPLLA